jgi:outer membrane protein assembly factor BamB
MNRASAFLALCIFLVSGIAPACAKRPAPAPVAPVVADGVRYSAPMGAMSFVVAAAADTGKELWRMRIYGVRVDPNLERDVQDVFITSLEVKQGMLIITNERGEKYALDLKTRKVTRQ